MMTDKLRTAAQAALDAMSVVRVFVTTEEKIKHPEGTDWYDNIRINLDDSIVNDIKEMNALEAALAEPAIKDSLTVAVQERMHPEIKKMYEDYFDKCFRESSAQQRQWVGLTDDEIEHLRNDQPWWMVRDIEAKLKDKNT
jgi:hypothetical protein